MNNRILLALLRVAAVTLSLSPVQSLRARINTAILRRRFPGTLLGPNSKIPLEDVSIGYGTYGTVDIQHLRAPNTVTIGNFCSIGKDVLLLAGGNHPHQRPSLYPFRSKRQAGRDVDSETKGPIKIGHDVWIGNRCIILSGVKIGDGSVIGAGSVVAGDVEPFSIVVGNPARCIAKRFTETECAAMERIAWWNWDDETINARLESFYMGIQGFIDSYDYKIR